MVEKPTFIPSRLKNCAIGGHVAGTSDIIDDEKGKTQDVINTETDESIGSINTAIGDDNIEGTIKGRLKEVEDIIGTGGAIDERIADAVNALDSEQSGTSSDNKVSVKVTEVDGKLTGVTVTTNDIASASDVSDINKKIVSEASELNKLIDKKYVDDALAEEEERAKAAEKANADNLTAEVSRAKGAEEANANAIAVINKKIPSDASETNKLADKAFVNSSISTATATFKGTYNTLEELQAVTADNNDYGFVVSQDAAGNTVYNRYKYEGTQWSFEYALNNSSFTTTQWSAINSGITSGEVNRLSNIASGAQVNVIESIKVNNSEVTPVNKTVNISVPTLLAHLDDDETHRLVTDTEKDTWNNKQAALSFDGNYSTLNKVATQSTVKDAIDALDVTDITGFGADKTLATLKETDGKISATFQDIEIKKSQVSDFPTLGTASGKDVPASGNASAAQVVMGNDTRLSDSRTPKDHAHGNIKNGGTLQDTDVAVANGDKLVITDNSDSSKVARSSISFDGTTETQALTKKGTWKAFAQLDSTGKVPYEQLPAIVDDVIEGYYIDGNFYSEEAPDVVTIGGVKWSKKNVGATEETDYGNFYMYGKGASQYNASDDIYQGTEDPLSPDVDTATQVLGSDWKTPTKSEFESLISDSDYTWVTNYRDSGHNGGLFTSKTESWKEIFFPAAGVKLSNPTIDTENTLGCYLCATPSEGLYLHQLYLNSLTHAVRSMTTNDARMEGLTVRGVYTGAMPEVITPESGKIYVDKNTNLIYRWNGTIYVEINKSLALGTTASTAYRGDYGDIAYTHSQTEHAPSDATKTYVSYNTSLKRIEVSVNDKTTSVVGASKIVSDGGGIKTVVDHNPTLNWNTRSKVATIGSTDIHVVMPDISDSDTTYKLKIGAFWNGDEDGKSLGELENKEAASEGQDLSLVTTGEKYVWNSKQDAIDNLQNIIEGAKAGATAYQLPTEGMPKDDLSSDVKKSLSAADTAVQPSDLDGYQKTLVSGTNIKTINDNSILGSGNLVISTTGIAYDLIPSADTETGSAGTSAAYARGDHSHPLAIKFATKEEAIESANELT